LTDLELEDGTVLTTTEDHPYWSVDDHRFERADQFVPGEKVLGADWRVIAVAGLRIATAREGLAYNLSVDGIHTYHVGQSEILVHNICRELLRRFDSLSDARSAARSASGLGDDAVDFVQEIGPFAGRVTGRVSPDGLRGWRIDLDGSKGFHVNWWDRTGGPKRASWRYGANTISGGTYDDFLSLLSHFPRS